MIAPADIAFLPRGVRTHRDRVRDADVLLAPERVLMLDEIGLAILSRLDGVASVGKISQDLAQSYDAPLDVIEPDVIEYLTDLRDKGFVHVRLGRPPDCNAGGTDASLPFSLPVLFKPHRTARQIIRAFNRDLVRHL